MGPLFLLLSLSSAWACPDGSECRAIEAEINFQSHASVGDRVADAYCADTCVPASGPEAGFAQLPFPGTCNLRVVFEGGGRSVVMDIASSNLNRYLFNRYYNDRDATVKPMDRLNDVHACVPTWHGEATRLRLAALDKPPECATTKNDFISRSGFCADGGLVASGNPAEDATDCGRQRSEERARYNQAFGRIADRLAGAIGVPASTGAVATMTAQRILKPMEERIAAACGDCVNCRPNLPAVAPELSGEEAICDVIRGAGGDCSR